MVVVDIAPVAYASGLDAYVEAMQAIDLSGITRRTILKLAETGAIAFEERLFTVEEAKSASEAFLTSASSFVMPIVEIDGAMVGGGQPGPVTRKLREMYLAEAKNG